MNKHKKKRKIKEKRSKKRHLFYKNKKIIQHHENFDP